MADDTDALATDGAVVILTPQQKRDRITSCLTEVGVRFNTSAVSVWKMHYHIITGAALLVGEEEFMIALPFDHSKNIKDAWTPRLQPCWL